MGMVLFRLKIPLLEEHISTQVSVFKEEYLCGLVRVCSGYGPDRSASPKVGTGLKIITVVMINFGRKCAID